MRSSASQFRALCAWRTSLPKKPEFFNALLGIWLGQSPADAQLKDALLGQALASAMPNQP